jgi:hypothetical protein
MINKTEFNQKFEKIFPEQKFNHPFYFKGNFPKCRNAMNTKNHFKLEKVTKENQNK